MHKWAKRGLQAALVTGGLFVLGTGVAVAAESCPDRPSTPLDGVGPVGWPSVTVPIDVEDNAVGTPFGQFEVPAVRQDVSTREVESALGGRDTRLPAALSGLGASTPRGGDTGSIDSNRVDANLLVPADVKGNAVALGGPVTVENNSGSTHDQPQNIVTSGDGGTATGNVLAVNGVAPFEFEGNAVGFAGSAHTHNSSTSATHAPGSVSTSGDSASLAGNGIYVPAAVPIKAAGNALALAGGNASTDSQTNTSAVSGSTVSSEGNESSGSGNFVVVPVAQPFGFNGNAVGALGSNEHATSADAVFAQAGGNTTTQGDHSMLSGNLAGAPIGNTFALDGNPGGVLTNASTHGHSQDAAFAGGNSSASGDESFGAGNALSLPQSVPTGIAGNALGGLTNAYSSYDRQVSSTSGGQATTTGDAATLSGNAASTPLVGPLDLTDNGGGLITNAISGGSSAESTEAGGNTSSTGNGGFAAGNLAGAPVALPLAGAGNGGGLATNTHTAHSGFVASHAGGNTSTAGNGSTLSGFIADGPLAAPAAIASNTGGVATTGTTGGSSDQNASAGGVHRTAGLGSTASGDVAQLPVSVPTGDFANVHGVLVNGLASHVTRQYGEAGGATYTRGDGSLGSGDVAGDPVSVPVGDFANVNGVLVNGAAQGGNAVTGTAGGFTGSNGQDGLASGDIVAPAAATSGQTFGSAIGVLENGTAVATNDTTSTADEPGTSTIDDAGTLTSDAVTPVVAGPVQGFANSGGVLSNTVGQATNNTATSAGGSTQATGVGGAVAGDVAEIPAAVPVQAFGNSAPVAGTGAGLATSDTTSAAGGPVGTDGTGGAVAGDVLDAPVGGPAQLFGNALSGAGIASAGAANHTALASGGDVVAAGYPGSFDGCHVFYPVNGQAQGFGNAFTIGGIAHGFGIEEVDSSLGGRPTQGVPAIVAVADGQPVEPTNAGTYIYNVPAAVLGQAVAGCDSADGSPIGIGDGTATTGARSGIDLPTGGDTLLHAAELPILPPLGTLTNGGGVNRPVLPSAPGGSSARSLMPQATLPTVGASHLPLGDDAVPNLNDLVPDRVLAGLAAPHVVPGARQERAAGSSTAGLPTGDIPALSALDGATVLRQIVNPVQPVVPSAG